LGNESLIFRGSRETTWQLCQRQSWSNHLVFQGCLPDLWQRVVLEIAESGQVCESGMTKRRTKSVVGVLRQLQPADLRWRPTASPFVVPGLLGVRDLLEQLPLHPIARVLHHLM
jgi:hypothetical protein